MALNQIVLMGRLTRDPEIRYFEGSNNSVTRFTIAVERDYKAANEDKPKTDFIDCAAWNKTGEFVAQYFSKGSMIAVIGSVETNIYINKDGVKMKKTEVNVDRVSFTGERRNSGSSPEGDDFMSVPDNLDEELPFN